MAAKKSIKRVKVEKAFARAGVDVSNVRHVYVDKRKTGFTRIKFSFVHLTAKQRLDVRHELRKEFTHTDFRLQDIPELKNHWMGAMNGTAVSLYD